EAEKETVPAERGLGGVVHEVVEREEAAVGAALDGRPAVGSAAKAGKNHAVAGSLEADEHGPVMVRAGGTAAGARGAGRGLLLRPAGHLLDVSRGVGRDAAGVAVVHLDLADAGGGLEGAGTQGLDVSADRDEGAVHR